MTVTLHGTPRSRAIRNLWLAEEIGLDYRHDAVDFRDGGTGSEAYRALGTMGQVPAMSDGDLVLTESLAINLYLAKKAGGALAPRTLAEDALCEMWTLFAATQIEPRAQPVFMNTLHLPEAERDPAKVTEALDTLRRPLAHLDRKLGEGGGHLVGGRFTVADVNVAMCVFYLRAAPGALDATPNVKAWYGACAERPAWRKVMAWRGE